MFKSNLIILFAFLCKTNQEKTTMVTVLQKFSIYDKRGLQVDRTWIEFFLWKNML